MLGDICDIQGICLGHCSNTYSLTKCPENNISNAVSQVFDAKYLR